MTELTRPGLPPLLAQTGVVAIIRGARGDHVHRTTVALIDAGLTCLELTMNTPTALETLARIGAERRGVELGVGTVLAPQEVDAAADAGAAFIVAPNVDEQVGRACHRRDLPWFPGAATPTEIQHAWSLGACAVKVFPARQLGGPAYLKQVASPLDQIRLLPTGGISAPDVAGYIAAGAVAIGVGGPLIGDALETGDTADLQERAVAMLRSVQEARGT